MTSATAELASIAADLAALTARQDATPAPDVDQAVQDFLLTDTQRLMDKVRDMVRAVPIQHRPDFAAGYLEGPQTGGPDPVLESILQGVTSPC